MELKNMNQMLFYLFVLSYIHMVRTQIMAYPESAITYYCFPQPVDTIDAYSKPSYTQDNENDGNEENNNCIVKNISMEDKGFFLIRNQEAPVRAEHLDDLRTESFVNDQLVASQVNRSGDDQAFYLMAVFIFCFLLISVMNVIINYCTLNHCISIKRPVNKWYHIFAVNHAASLRYVFNTLRNENEMLHEQVYLLIKHLKNNDKHIIVINRNAIENEAKYDYVRFSRYMHLKTPLYEAPFDLKKCIVEDASGTK